MNPSDVVVSPLRLVRATVSVVVGDRCAVCGALLPAGPAVLLALYAGTERLAVACGHCAAELKTVAL